MLVIVYILNVLRVYHSKPFYEKKNKISDEIYNKFKKNTLLKQDVNNLRSFFKTDKNEGLNVLKSYYKQINTGLKIIFNFSSLDTKSLGFYSFFINYFKH